MLLKLVVLVGLALYLATQGHWLFAALALSALWPKIGIGVAIPLAALLAVAGQVWPALILGTLIVGSLVGNHLLQRGRAGQAPE